MGAENTVLVVGSGQSGFQAVASLRDRGFAGRVVLIGDEPGVPYQRPPLSKAYLAGTAGIEQLHLRGEDFFAEKDIELVAGRVAAIDRPASRVRLEDGTELAYDHLVLATGSRNRTLPVPGADLPGVLTLRTRDDADRLRASLSDAEHVVVVGGGFIGLEFASHAGRPVTIVEAQDRLLNRVATPEISACFADLHREAGHTVLLGQGVSALHGDSRVREVELSDGTRLPADLVVVAVGVVPETTLAAEAGLPVDNGVVVDAHLRTADERIFAIGDCASFPCVQAGAATRLESVQNAVDQARCVAAAITGTPEPYASLPWFWTDQAGAKLQIAGLLSGADKTVVAGDRAAGKFSVLSFRDDVLIAVESVNKPADHIAARRLFAAEPKPAYADLEASEFNLKEHLKVASTRG
ncbi:3-phenylpropionate/trans-cinnamate dioxygenase ferredoxin reductase subunit [Amycolatopsis pretoriensis]|uniref:3-phenylpropionate/trans-cinnamate dioxygenase ferredoxin reductase subunit n=1 Tax=Amycolatopsis pretoriensis TaxID=218821 RepID=A0A1H5QYI8_9PSEU|nr:FAD-dependent oxidoreductase [Amycolatopsis pretoriensis]SEF30894.1 3-phenylpropionate/trans-cinnamate dioxygenase ferredoxin reductase subunit [Amycolatopsis pretoriensis]